MTAINTCEKDVSRIRGLPCWQGNVAVSPLEGGITNHNYLVQDEQNQFVARLGSDIPEHMIMRFNEVAAGKAAHAAGLSPNIVHHENGVLIMEYIQAKPLTPDDIKNTGTLAKIINLLHRCHRDIPLHLRGASLVFWVFHVIRDYASTLKDANSRHQSELPDFLQAAIALEEAAAPFDIVFGHNDLLPGNILDDGKRLWLIDWEYAGFNTPLFDLGGLASNNGLDEIQERWMLEQYFGETPDQILWAKYCAMKCASLLRETLWSMVSEIYSTLDFDYASYTGENLERYQRALASYEAL